MSWAEDCESIRQTIALYCQLLDDQRFDELAELFADDAELYWDGRLLKGRSAIVESLPATQLRLGQASHLPMGPVIRIAGQSATVWTDTIVTVQPAEGPPFIGWIGRYHQRFGIEGGRWRISAHIALGVGEPLPAGVEAVDPAAGQPL